MRINAAIYMCKKHKTPAPGLARYPDEHLHDELALKRLVQNTRNLPWAKA
jgi:hypothetical protein